MRLIVLGILMVFAASCSKQQADRDGATEIKLNTSIEKSASKAVVQGNVFPDGSTLGLFVYHSELGSDGQIRPLANYEPYGTRYKNIRAYFANSTKGWQFRFESSSTSFEDVFLIEPPAIYSQSKQITLVSYAPWIQGCTNIKSVPVTLGGDSRQATDLMWARENCTVGNSIEPDGEDKIINLHYKHALSLLKINIKCKHDVSVMKVNSITLKKKENGTTELYGKGSLNAIDGTFNPFKNEDRSTAITVNYEQEDIKFSSQNIAQLPIMIFPTEYHTDGDYILEFTFNGETLAATYPIKMQDIKIGNETAFKQGYSYTFNFTFNNYMLIDNVKVNVDETWTPHNHELQF